MTKFLAISTVLLSLTSTTVVLPAALCDDDD
jgi:hypothetical protein